MHDLSDLFRDVSPVSTQDAGVASTREGSCVASTNDPLPAAFKKAKFPPVTKKLFLPIIPDSGGLTCLGLATAGLSAASFFKTLPLDMLRTPAEGVVRTSHQNLANLQEVYTGADSVILTYDSWGISLHEICRASNIFAGNETAVATICKEALKGLKYIHETLGLAHGNLSCRTILVTEHGQVKIADIGESIIQAHGMEERDLDCFAVGQVAKVLLQLNSPKEEMSTGRREAEDFADTPMGATIDELLEHPFLRRGIEPRSLKPFPLLLRILHPAV